ncbi:hypothetical protein [Portibacter marinus]|uniref:hypothetical protein n=1 Tax=Portibacter marinus TaxID=2898660 RepID=UPI001F2C2531|nr:hypothetical protein [Portibacter marinus]
MKQLYVLFFYFSGAIFIQAQNVGIDTESPTEKLHIFGGNMILDRGNDSLDLTRNIWIGGARNQNTSPFAQINFVNFAAANNNLDYTGGRISSFNTDNINSGDLRFYTSFQGTLYERMIINHQGKVGIGINNPSSLLHVNGTITSDGGNSEQWNEAYSWGNHANVGYVSSAGPSSIVEFTSTQEWDCPPGVTSAIVEIWGSGGGGGGGGTSGGSHTCGTNVASDGSSGGGSGASGTYVRAVIDLVPGEKYQFFIGSGGQGGGVGQFGQRGVVTHIEHIPVNIPDLGMLISVPGGGGGGFGRSSSDCNAAGGFGGLVSNPFVPNGGLIRLGREGRRGVASEGGQIFNESSCFCGQEVVVAVQAPEVIAGSVELPRSAPFSQGGEGGEGSRNGTAPSAGGNGGQAYIIMTVYSSN